MIALDTNVLVRFLVEDDAEQSLRAQHLLKEHIRREDPLYVPDIVLAELVWVLSVSYKLKRQEIEGILRELVRARHLSFESTDRISRALRAYRSLSGDFADYLIREQGRDAGCIGVATFDENLLADPGFVALPNT